MYRFIHTKYEKLTEDMTPQEHLEFDTWVRYYDLHNFSKHDYQLVAFPNKQASAAYHFYEQYHEDLEHLFLDGVARVTDELETYAGEEEDE